MNSFITVSDLFRCRRAQYLIEDGADAIIKFVATGKLYHAVFSCG